MSDRQPTTPEPQTEWPVIHTSTPAQRPLADGVLVDVTSAAREAGFKVPTAVTATVFDECIEWTESDAEQSGSHQDQKGRLWDVVYLDAFKARTLVKRGVRQNQVTFQLDVVPRPGRTSSPPPDPQARHRPRRQPRARRHHHASQRRLNPADNRTIGCPPQHKNLKGDRAEPPRDQHPLPAHRPAEPAPRQAGPKRERRARPRKAIAYEQAP